MKVDAEDVHSLEWMHTLPITGEITIKKPIVQQCTYCGKKHVHNTGDDVCSVCMCQGNKLTAYKATDVLRTNVTHPKGAAWLCNPENPTGKPQTIYGEPLVTKDGRVLLVEGTTNAEFFKAWPISLPKAVKGDIPNVYEFYGFYELTADNTYRINMLADEYAWDEYAY